MAAPRRCARRFCVETSIAPMFWRPVICVMFVVAALASACAKASAPGAVAAPGLGNNKEQVKIGLPASSFPILFVLCTYVGARRAWIGPRRNMVPIRAGVVLGSTGPEDYDDEVSRPVHMCAPGPATGLRPRRACLRRARIRWELRAADKGGSRVCDSIARAPCAHHPTQATSPSLPTL